MKGLRVALACLAGALALVDVAGATTVEKGSAAAPAEKVFMTQATVAAVGLDIVASCQGRAVYFSFVNIGDDWPATAAIKVIRLSDRSLLFERSMRMAKHQKGSFRLQAEKNPGGEIGFFVEPSWTERPFTVDAKVTCK